MASIHYMGVKKSFGSTAVLRGIDLHIDDGKFVVFVGPSGCGKSTLLRVTAGLESLDEGQIFMGQEPVQDLVPGRRNVAMVFQDYALYPHMTVFENMAFGLRARGMRPADINTRVSETAKLLQIDRLLARYPAQLSGGQRQRVAMGRAMVKDAQAFLYDEPLSNLDAALRDDMRVEIRRLHRQKGTTSIYVTHDQVEAMTLAEHLVVLNNGVIQQSGSPMEVFQRPKSLFVAQFIGLPRINIVAGRTERRGHEWWFVEKENRVEWSLPESKTKNLKNALPVLLGIRPSDLRLTSSEFHWRARVKVDVVEPLGKEAIIIFDLNGIELRGESSGYVLPEEGGNYEIGLNLHHAMLFSADGFNNLEI